jgi:putative intracellular protease/amidase
VQFESQTAFRDFFANHSVLDGRLVTGQNQNAGAEVANKMMMVAKGGLR